MNLPSVKNEWREYLEPLWNDKDGLEYAIKDLKHDALLFDGSFPSDKKNREDIEFAIKEAEERLKELR